MKSFRIAAALSLPLTLLGLARNATSPRFARDLCTLLAALQLAGCAHSPSYDPSDPLEPVNRAVFTFNETVDRYALRPVAKGYDAVMPKLVRHGLRNFFSNLFYPTVLVNDLLQLKFQQSGADFCRLVFNSTFGLAGFIDIATLGGLPEHDEDFGQTLGYWGVGPGWYLMLPLLGPSNNRDLVGKAGDYATNIFAYVDEEEVVSLGMGAAQAVEKRAQLLSLDKIMEQQLDRYVFVRTGYLQIRLNKVYDGNPPKEDYGLEDEPEE